MKKRNQAVRILAGLCLPAALLLSSLFVSAAETGTNDIQTGTGTDNSSGTNTKSSTAENREDMDGSPEPRTEAEISVTEIRNAQEFLEFARNCSSDAFSLNRTVRLTADIDLSDAALSGNSFEGIPYFHGIFEGNGHTISQFKLTPKGSSHGFFRYIGEAGTVRNLNLDGIVRPEGSQEQIGGLAGVNYGVVENCSFTGSVRGKKSVGAVAGINKSTGKIISCRSNASVTATYYTGGIAGKNEGQISGCRSESSVNTEDPETTLDLGGVDLGSFNLTQNIVNQNHTGGIAGSSDGIINSCKNTGTVGLKHTGYNTGGIAGIQSGIILMCENEGEIHGRKDVGGIAGQTVPYVESEYLEDKVSKTKEDISRLSRTISGISSAMQKTSSQAKQYTDSLISRYNSSMQSVSGSLNALSGAVSREYPQAQEYVNQINNALAAISAIQNESQELSAEQLDAINSNLGIISDCLSRLQEILPDTSGSIQELLAGINSQLQNGANLNNIRDLAAAIDRQVSYIQNYLGAVSGSILHILGGIGHRVGVLAGVLGHLVGNALAGCLDLLAQLVALLVDGGGNVAGSLLDGSGHIGAAGSRLGGDLLAAGGHVVHHFGAPGGSLAAPLLGIAQDVVGLVGHHSAGLSAGTRRGQQGCDGTDDATDQKHSKFVGHDCLLYRRNIKFVHYRVRASRPQPLMRGSHLTVNKPSNIIDEENSQRKPQPVRNKGTG